MTDEEKKAIEQLKKVTYNNDYYTIDLHTVFGFTTWNYCFEIILNLIEKQEKELAEYKLLNANIEKANEILKEYEKQEKVIDEMIKWIDDRCFYSDDCGNFCEIINDTCHDITKNWKCEDCIKEYFYRKVEDE